MNNSDLNRLVLYKALYDLTIVPSSRLPIYWSRCTNPAEINLRRTVDYKRLGATRNISIWHYEDYTYGSKYEHTIIGLLRHI